MYVSLSRLRVPAHASEELIAAFRRRAHLVDDADGFGDLQVWRSDRDAGEILMVSRCQDRDTFKAYMKSHDHRTSHERIEWLAGILDARGYPVQRLARDLEIAAEVVAPLRAVLESGATTVPARGRPAARRPGYGDGVRRLLALTALAPVLALTAATPALADPYDDYRQDGSINECDYSADELRQTLDDLPPDVIQYSPGLADQLAAGQAGCGGQAPGAAPETRDTEVVPAPPSAGGGGSALSGSPGDTRRARVLDPPTPKADPQLRLANLATPAPSVKPANEGVPAWALLVLGGLALLGVLGFVAVRALNGRDPVGSGRFSDAWTEAWETVRLGR